MSTPTSLELNYLTATLLLNYYNNKVEKKHKKTKDSVSEFRIKHPAYIDVPMSMMHLSIICARELYEAKQRDGLQEADWLRLRELRNSIAHAVKKEDQEIRFIATSEEVFTILNKLNKHLYDKYNLDTNKTWQAHIKNYYKDLDRY
ncbi:hypothetical protein [Acholeplasma laidlawii]|uniref:Uncharacterized protein n=2 Tax=Acholeplasma laidlawii TaxID=2148 RepID=A9NHN5_ACHLI|nr:hypothetical protein [Acholeplasma laidlawii]ABX81865.1 hypothetical protein ACL_1266 [Acholeplasma laidlawii PG-8A]NWH10851.1 hypothetical protein [Acholeplasma laidlawii]NWH12236.1 hypothetical protein [Acholeplasma laidlawii]NWH13622.1 hypothetical protein [Acholeplasma laidlawii]NWH14211.1 hypothetical protein [Acholeplasma laidlawii]